MDGEAEPIDVRRELNKGFVSGHCDVPTHHIVAGMIGPHGCRVGTNRQWCFIRHFNFEQERVLLMKPKVAIDLILGTRNHEVANTFRATVEWKCQFFQQWP